MATIIVYSPFSGEEVKVLPKDVGKAVRDKSGKLFYVLPKSDKSGYYGAPTRAGGQRAEQKAEHMAQRIAQSKRNAKDRQQGKKSSSSKSSGRQRQQQQATAGSGMNEDQRHRAQRAKAMLDYDGDRKGGVGVMSWIIFLGVIGGGIWLFMFGPLKGLTDQLLKALSGGG